MAQPSYAPVRNSVSVIGSQSMAPYPFDVIVDTYSKGYLVITDVNKKIMFKAKPHPATFHDQRLLLDADDIPIVTLREKRMSGHRRWEVFRGESKSDSDKIFSAKKAHVIQSKTNVHVFLVNNSKEDVCDFKIQGSWSERNCTISMGDSSKTIANIRKMRPLGNAKFVKDKFMVTISPNVDHAFVVALIAIVDAMKNPIKCKGEAVATQAVSLVVTGGFGPS